MDLAAALAAIRPIDVAARDAAAARHLRLTKPPGALGLLETLGGQLAGIARACPPPRPVPAAVAVFVGDHGVVAQGVTPWPQEVTAQMVTTFCAGKAAISVLSRIVGASVTVIDVGVATDLTGQPGLVGRNVRRGTGDIAVEEAMTIEEAAAAVAVGAEIASRLCAEGARCLVMGEMGIGNTTPSAALIAALCGVPASVATGRGAGVDDAGLAHKVSVVDAALRRAGADDPAWGNDIDGLTAVAQLGGLEIAALAGFVLGGAAARVPVIVDGVISLAALAVADRLHADVVGYCIAGHRSTEPAASIMLGRLGLRPLLELDMRLGEGTGACLAVPLLDAAASVLTEMATFDEVGIER